MPESSLNTLPKAGFRCNTQGVSGGFPQHRITPIIFGADLIVKFKEKDMLQTKQKGFTLLELLVVITLLAVLSVGALVAYEGIGENANNVAAANNIKVADSAIRTYRALEGVYPNQWDNLAPLTGAAASGAATGPLSVMAPATLDFFGQWEVPNGDASGTVWQRVGTALARVGITELQTLQPGADIDLTQTSPNQAWNESAPGVSIAADELEWEVDDGAVEMEGGVTAFNLSIVPSGGDGGTCTAGGVAITNNFNGDNVNDLGLGDNTRLNYINDNLDDDGCDLVLALGFGKDVPGTTSGSRVAISTAPTYTNGNVVNPSIHYARYVALFHVATAEEGTGAIVPGDVFTTPRLIAVVDTEGRTIDQAIAGAFAKN
jgi:prepilin-type N-terminal cleavage/methylation domain-containing protein